MKRNRAKSSNLFLLELILAILFFAIASAVCVQLFVKSHLLSKNTTALNAAINQASSAGEAFKSGDSMDESYAAIGKVFPDASIDKSAGTVSYTYKVDDEYYYLNLILTEDATLGTCQINVTVLDSSANQESSDIMTLEAVYKDIYTLTVEKHFQRRTS